MLLWLNMPRENRYLSAKPGQFLEYTVLFIAFTDARLVTLHEQVSMTWHVVRHLYASPTSESSKGLLLLPFVGSGSGGGRVGEGVMGAGTGRVGDVGGDEDRGDSRHHSGEKGSDSGGLPPGTILTQVSEDLDSDVNATDDGDIIEKNFFNMPGLEINLFIDL